MQTLYRHIQPPTQSVNNKYGVFRKRSKIFPKLEVPNTFFDKSGDTEKIALSLSFGKGSGNSVYCFANKTIFSNFPEELSLIFKKVPTAEAFSLDTKRIFEEELLLVIVLFRDSLLCLKQSPPPSVPQVIKLSGVTTITVL